MKSTIVLTSCDYPAGPEIQ